MTHDLLTYFIAITNRGHNLYGFPGAIWRGFDSYKHAWMITEAYKKNRNNKYLLGTAKQFFKRAQ